MTDLIDPEFGRRALESGADLDGMTPAQVDAVGVALAQTIMRTAGPAYLERFLLTLDQADGGVIHHFGPGLYSREVTFPPGVIAMGHRQRHEHTNIMLRGRLTMIGEDGTAQTITGPTMGVGQPGRKIGVIHETTTWINVYPNPDDCQDIATLEDRWIDRTDDAAATVSAVRSDRDPEPDRASYRAALADLGLSEFEVQADMQLAPPEVPLPWGGYKFRTAPSPIHGIGLFASAPIAEGEIIAPALIGQRKTAAGRFCNHGAAPNAAMIWLNDETRVLMALRQIGGNRGGLDGEEILVDYRACVADSQRGELP